MDIVLAALDSESLIRERSVTSRFFVIPRADVEGLIESNPEFAREMVSRLLRDLVAGGYIATDNRQIMLLKPLPRHW